MVVGYAAVVSLNTVCGEGKVFVFIDKKATARLFTFLWGSVLGLVLLSPQARALHSYHGVITSSFRASAQQVGVDSQLAAAFIDIFAPQLDFERDLRRGDRWRFALRDRREGIGVAEYVPRRGRKLQAVRYEVAGRGARYYSPDDGGAQEG